MQFSTLNHFTIKGKVISFNSVKNFLMQALAVDTSNLRITNIFSSFYNTLLNYCILSIVTEIFLDDEGWTFKHSYLRRNVEGLNK